MDKNLLAFSLRSIFDRLGSADAIAVRERNLFSELSRDRGTIVVCGAGQLGVLTLATARRAGVTILAVADNNPRLWGTTLGGVSIVSPEAAVAQFGDIAYFVTAVYNSSGLQEQLSILNCGTVVPFPAFFWGHADLMDSTCGLDLPTNILRHSEHIQMGFDALADDRSRVEYASQIGWRCSLRPEWLTKHDNPSEIYFPRDLFAMGDSETLVDCGAFDGDSIRMFLARTSRRFARIVGCEPDGDNRAALRRSLVELPDAVQERISVLPYAVSDTDGRVRFRAGDHAGSRVVSEDEGDSAECRTLDTILGAVTPTIIKMDIEGSEPKALNGAVNTCRRARPVLAICAYHSCDHLWLLPTLIRSILPEYDIHLRRYAEDCWESVYYAVPPERRPH